MRMSHSVGATREAVGLVRRKGRGGNVSTSLHSGFYGKEWARQGKRA